MPASLERNVALLEEALEKGREVTTSVPLALSQLELMERTATEMQHRLMLVRGELPIIRLDRAVDTIIGATATMERMMADLKAIKADIEASREDIDSYMGDLKS